MTTLSRSITLAPGEATEVAFTVTPTAAGVFRVAVDGLTGSFIVTAPVPPAPADIQLFDLVIYPSTVLIGEAVTISVSAVNRGGTRGTKTITLTVT